MPKIVEGSAVLMRQQQYAEARAGRPQCSSGVDCDSNPARRALGVAGLGKASRPNPTRSCRHAAGRIAADLPMPAGCGRGVPAAIRWEAGGEPKLWDGV